MKNKIWQLGLLIGILLGSLTLVAKADNLNYTVTADLPKNQITEKVSYFDLLVKPSQKQTLTIRIKNSDSQAHRYVVSPNRAITNDNGVIDYSHNNAKADPSAKFDLNTALSGKQTITVPAKATKKVAIKVAVPKQGFEGVALGGISVTQAVSAAKKSSGMTIQNQYAYVIGLQLQTHTPIKIAPKMKLLGVRAKQIDYQNYVTATLQNTQPVIMHDLKIKSYVTAADSSKKVLTTNKDHLAMAPNSQFNFAIGDGSKPLQAGNYTMHLSATAGNGKYHWTFTRNFTISEQRAKTLNQSAVGQKAQPNYFWWFVGLGVVIIALLGTIIGLLLKNRRHKQD